MKYLTEKLLGEELKIIFPKNEFIHDKIVPESGSRKRPDYRCEELKLIVEFDGYHHYSIASKVISEEEKTELYKSMGYTVIRIPYFVQLSSEVIRHLFNINIDFKQYYPHGFISDKCLLPCDFCELGIKKFKKQLKDFWFVADDVDFSLSQKINKLGNINLVLPPSLQ